MQGAHQVGGFGGDMQTAGKAHSLKGLFLGEAFADRTQDWHFTFRPLDTAASTFCLIDVSDIVVAHKYSLNLYTRNVIWKPIRVRIKGDPQHRLIIYFRLVSTIGTISKFRQYVCTATFCEHGQLNQQI